MRLRQPGESRCHALEVVENEVERTPRDEHRSRVHDVLAGRPPVDVVGCVSSDLLAQRAHERLGRAPDRPSACEQVVEVEQLRPARVGDRSSSLGRDDASASLGLGQRALELEHSFEPRSTGDRVEQLLRDEERPERRHTTKNVVCPSP